MAAPKPPAANSAKKAKAIPRSVRLELYAGKGYLGRDTQARLELRIPFDVYFQDPFVTDSNPTYDFDKEFVVPWEPGIGDGPTSARFVVVDYDSTAGVLNPAAHWNEESCKFEDPEGAVLDRNNRGSPQFRQMNVWATLQDALDFFESGFGLGRRIEWGFEGSRLIVVPHAGYGENAYYDRESKSLQFYYFDRPAKKDGEYVRIHTCLSADIIHHEFGHAVLDGVRPHYHESVMAETAAFHEFLGDLSAILIAFRNNVFRAQVASVSGADLDGPNPLASIAEEFGRNVGDSDYLRSALNHQTYAEVKDSQRPHFMSEVLTGAMFDIVRRLTRYNVTVKGDTVREALWATIRRMQCMAVQPLDLLPPVDVTFADYAEAVLRNEQIVNPTDPDGYRTMMIGVFVERGILGKERAAELKKPAPVFQRLDMAVFHDPQKIAASRANAYRFLDDNRRELLIPYAADVVVTDLAEARKLTITGSRQPRQVLLQYMWREDVVLNGERFGRFAGQTASLLCGGTLALDADGNKLAWARKPGTLPLVGGPKKRRAEMVEARAGLDRQAAFLDALAARIAAGRIGGAAPGGAAGLLEKAVAPVTARSVDGTLRFELSPHIGIRSDEHEELGERPWSISF